MTSKTKQGKKADEVINWMIKHPRKVNKMTYEDIAARFGLSVGPITRRVWAAVDQGIEVPMTAGKGGRSRVYDVESLLRGNHDSREWTREQIAEFLGCHPVTVGERLLELHRAGSKLVKNFKFNRERRVAA